MYYDTIALCYWLWGSHHTYVLKEALGNSKRTSLKETIEIYYKTRHLGRLFKIQAHQSFLSMKDRKTHYCLCIKNWLQNKVEWDVEINIVLLKTPMRFKTNERELLACQVSKIENVTQIKITV